MQGNQISYLGHWTDVGLCGDECLVSRGSFIGRLVNFGILLCRSPRIPDVIGCTIGNNSSLCSLSYRRCNV